MTSDQTAQAKLHFTGATIGIGRAPAVAFAQEGANVVMADISEQGGLKTAQPLRTPVGEEDT
jgi:NAD(P)-dependent dehydrogenase (short-subunit alcohol dehydrogenase family)